MSGHFYNVKVGVKVSETKTQAIIVRVRAKSKADAVKKVSVSKEAFYVK